MALLAETLVDEWLNRQGFFTVRGRKHGVDELDLLAVRPAQAAIEAWHVEVQASFRPIGYISKLAKDVALKSGLGRTTAKSRAADVLEASVKEWVDGKFHSKTKVAARDKAWPGLKWQLILVHAVVREPKELELIASNGVRLVPLHVVLRDIARTDASTMRGAAGTDLAELIDYYNRNAC